MSDAEMKITWKGQLAALLIGLVALVVVSELVLRIIYPTWHEFYAGNFMTIENVPGHGNVTVGRKGFDGYFSQNNGDFRAHIHINDFGLRDDAPVAAANNKIWIIGDSMAFGWGVEANERYSSVVGDILNEPTFNIASPGTNVCGYQALSARMPKDIKPRAVVVGLILENDLQLYDCRATAEAAKQHIAPQGFNLASLKETMTEKSALYNFFAVALKRVDVVREALIAMGVVKRSQAYRNLLADQNIDQITESTAVELQRLREMFSPATPFSIMIAPARFEIANDDPTFKTVRLSMIAALQRHHLAYIDPIDGFKAAGFKDTHFMHDGHWSVQGHHIAAEAIAKWLRENVH